MTVQNGILPGKGDHQVFLDPRFANRHSLIVGATGTGKTITMRVLTEVFSKLGTLIVRGLPSSVFLK